MIIFSLLFSLIFSLHAMEEINSEKLIQFSDCIANSYQKEVQGKIDFLEKNDEKNSLLFIYYLMQTKYKIWGVNAMIAEYWGDIEHTIKILKKNEKYQASLTKALEATRAMNDAWEAFRKDAAYILEDHVKATTNIIYPDHTGKSCEEWEKDFFGKNKDQKFNDHDINSFIAAGLVLFNNRQIQYDMIKKELPPFMKMKTDNTNQ